MTRTEIIKSFNRALVPFAAVLESIDETRLRKS